MEQPSKRELEIICNMVPIGIFTTDCQGRITFWNETAQAITGYSRDEVHGGICDYFSNHAHKNNMNPAQMCSMFCSGKINNHECFLRHKNGHTISVLLNAKTLKGDNDTVIGVVASMTDITYFHNIEMRYENLSKDMIRRFSFHTIIGRSKPMQAVYHLLERAAESDASVLLLGDSGTGKELAAHAIHFNSARKTGPFVAVNCSALSETLLESELFGHVKGSFTGALKDKMGRFETANQGTLFLDEIGDISPLVQLKLLRVLQERVIERVGDSKPIPIDVRIIAATNKDLKQLLKQGDFREDLYYRLKVFPINLPPLRERTEDIPLLVDHFIGKFNNQTGKTIKGLCTESLKLLLDYCWPGNVRELENAIEHAFVLCQSDLIEPSHLPQEILRMDLRHDICKGTNRINQSDEQYQKTMLIDALRKSNGNKSKTAQLLGVSRVTVWSRMKKYGITDMNG